MRPGRFATLWFLYFGAVVVVQSALTLVLAEGFQVTAGVLATFATGLVVAAMGLVRLWLPQEETRPAEYGLWAYVAVFFAAGYTALVGYYVATVL